MYNMSKERRDRNPSGMIRAHKDQMNNFGEMKKIKENRGHMVDKAYEDQMNNIHKMRKEGNPSGVIRACEDQINDFYKIRL